jgi:hypothetical protein
VCGYPVTTIRRLMQGWRETPEGPAWDLLAHACELFELPPEELPEQLARSVTTCRIPALLAALIHQRRLLWRPLEFRALVAYRTARQLVAKANSAALQDGEADQLKSEAEQVSLRLLRAAESLWPAPAKPLADIVPQKAAAQALTAETAQARFEEFLQAAEHLEQARERAFQYLKEQLEPLAKQADTEEAQAQMMADRSAFGELLTLLEGTASRCCGDFEALLKQISTLDASAMGADFERRSDECGKSLKEACNSARFAKVLKRVDKTLPQGASAGESPAPNATIGELRALVETIAPQQVAAPEGPLDANAAAARFAVLEQAAVELGQIRDAGFAFLKEELTPRLEGAESDEGLAQIRGDREAVEALVAALKRAGDEGGQRLAALQAEMAHLDSRQLASDFEVRREACGKNFTALTALANFQKVLKRQEKQLAALAQRFPAATVLPPSPSIKLLLQRVVAALPLMPTNAPGQASQAAKEQSEKSDDAAAKQLPPPIVAAQATVPGVSGVAGLRQAIRHLESEVERLFRAAHATFEPYPAWCRLLPPLQALEASVAAREAETYYRLGQTTRARRIWTQLLRRDSMQEALLRNLAVCDTLEGDGARSLTSWRRYLEVLYQRAVLAGHPAERAAQRAQLHRVLGRSLATPSLCAKMENEWSQKIDAPALLTFLCSPGRVRGYIDHLLLEYLNSRFEFRSPAILLGIKRTETERLRAPAAEAMRTFLQAAGKLLPDRVRESFVVLAREAVEDAARQCESKQRMRLNRQANYADEERRQIEILMQIVEFRLKLVIAFQKNTDLVKHLTSVEFLDHLDRLGEIPLGQSPELLKIAGNSLGLEEEMLGELSKILRHTIVGGIMRFLLAPTEDDAERPVRERQYRKLVGEWVKSPALAGEVKLIEDTSPFLPDEVLPALQSEAPAQAVIDQLKRWSADYPACGGLSRILAQMLIVQESFDEAEAVVQRAREHAFYPPGLAQLNRLQNQLNARRMHKYWDDEAFDQALPLALEMIALDDAVHHHLVQNCLVVLKEGSTRQQRDPGSERVEQLMQGWFERAGQRRADKPADDPDYPFVNEADLAQVRELSGLARAHMILAPLGELSAADGALVVAQMDELLRREPGLIGGHFCRALGWLNKANAASDSSSRRSSLQKLVADMQIVEQQALDASLRKQAMSLLKQAQSHV